MLSDPRIIRSNPGQGWIYRPLGARVTEAANFLAVKISQRFTAYAQGFRGGSVCCSWKRGKVGVKEESDGRERERQRVQFVLLFAWTSLSSLHPVKQYFSLISNQYQPAVTSQLAVFFSYNKSALATRYSTTNRMLIIIMPGVSPLCLGKE